MKISEDTLQVINAIQNYAKIDLLDKENLALIFEIAANKLDHQLLMDIVFSGSYIYRLISISSDTNNNGSDLNKIKTELESEVLKFRTHIQSLNTNIEIESLKKLVDAEGFELLKLVSPLSHDLSVFQRMHKEMRK